MTKTQTETLDEITRAEADAQAAAQKAQAAAEAARLRAEQARQRAEQERENANRAYLEVLTKEQPEARNAALTAQGEKRAALEAAVREGGNVFTAYRAWVEASVRTWEIDSALQQQRYYFGQPSRETTAPRFNFAADVAAIVDRLSLQLADEAQERIRERKAAYLAGKATS